MNHELPSTTRMFRAFTDRDPSFEGVFFTAVLTTGIFCRPTCPARKPLPENVEFFATSRDALLAGYRPCRRCGPLRPLGESPVWLKPLTDAVDKRPTHRWRDSDLRDIGLDPTRVRRWFQEHHGMTFHAYSRARRLGAAMGRIKEGRQVSRTAFESGYESLSGFGEALKQLVGSAPTAAADAAIVTVTRIPTPLGPLVAGVSDGEIVLLEYADRRMLPTQFKRLAKALSCAFVPGEDPLLTELASQLAAYFEGERSDFDLPLSTCGTDFQERVWAALRDIPSGVTRSYADIARAIGQPTAVRAVARANGDNRIAILIPCHRVIGSNGKLVGYGGGLWRKKRLLEIEASAVQTELV